MTDKILSWMRGQCMTQPGDTVICAVSGGADSVCMLHVLLSLRNTLGITVEAAHFNHQLRSEESDRDEAFVRTLCAELGVVLHVDNGDVRARAAKGKTHSPRLGRHTSRSVCPSSDARPRRTAYTHIPRDLLYLFPPVFPT